MRIAHRKLQLTFITVLGIMGAALPTRVVAAPATCNGISYAESCPNDLNAWCSNQGCDSASPACYQGPGSGSTIYCNPFR